MSKPLLPNQSDAPDLGCTRQFSVRAEISLICEVRQGMGNWHKVRLDDISQAGFRMAWHPGTRHDTPLRIRIPGLQILTAHVRWKREAAIGCEFDQSLHVAVFEHIVREARRLAA